MSSKYNFEFVGVTDDHQIVWKLRSRLGQEWFGTFNVVGCTEQGDVHLDITVTSPENSTIPKKGWDMIRWKLHRHVINSVKQACKNPDILVAPSV